jgi:hypothetical protein
MDHAATRATHVTHAALAQAPRAPAPASYARADGTAARRLRYAAVAASVYAALVHNWVLPAHFREWWGYGLAFFLMAAAQGCYSGALLLWPRRSVFVAGIAGNAAILALWTVTRTLGIPFIGPHAGQVEAVAMPDLAAAVAEVALVIALGRLLWELPTRGTMPRTALTLTQEKEE